MAAVLVPDWTSREPLGHGHATGTPRQKVLFSHEPSPDPHSEAIPGKISAVFKSKAMGTPWLLLGCPSPAVRLSLQNQLCRCSRRGLLPFSPYTSPSVTFFLCPQHTGPRPMPHLSVSWISAVLSSQAVKWESGGRSSSTGFCRVSGSSLTQQPIVEYGCSWSSLWSEESKSWSSQKLQFSF